MKDGVDRGFADRHGDFEDLVFIDAGLFRELLGGLLDPVHAIQ